MRLWLFGGLLLFLPIYSPQPEAGMSVAVWQCINCGKMEKYRIGGGPPSSECPARYWNGRYWMPRMCDYRKRHTRNPNF
jgi:hypothetical protein